MWTAVLTSLPLILRLVLALYGEAKAVQGKSESDAAAFGRILNDALATIDKAKAARAAAVARDADPDKLRQSDGFRRD